MRYCFILMILVVACTQPEKEQPQKVAPLTPHLGESPKPAIVPDPEIHELVGADLFGEFHNDRVSFYTKDHPDLEIEGSGVNQVVFYYIDEELFQTKYLLEKDITSDLIRKNGKFRIRGMNSRNAYFIKRLRSRILYGSEIVSLINFYQLRWEKGNDEIIYQVRRDTVETFFSYTERVKGYKDLLRRIEATSD